MKIAISLLANIGQFTKGMDTAVQKLNGFEKSFGQVKTLMGAGAAVFAVKGMVDGFTEASKAVRQGENAVYAFAKAVPVVGGLTESFHSLYMEISGVNKQLEAAEKMMAAGSGLEKLQKQMELDFASVTTGKEPTAAEQKYQKTLDEIQKIENIMNQANRLDKSSPILNMETMKRKAKELYDLELSSYQLKEKEKQLEKEKKLALPFEMKAKQAIESIDPIQKHLNYVEELSELLNKNLLTQKQYNKAVDESAKALENTKFFGDASAIEIKAKRVIESIDPIQRHLNYVEELNGLLNKNLLTQKQFNKAVNESAKKAIDDKNTKSFGDASAIEIDRAISVVGLSMGGIKSEKQDITNTLIAETNRILSDMRQKQEMN